MGGLHNHGTGAYMMRGGIRGSLNAEHAHQYWYLSPPVPSWKLYQNPFFTEGQLIPTYIPHHHNTPLHHRANSFTSSEDLLPNSHHGLTIVAPSFAIKAPDAPPSQPNAFPPSPHLLLSRENCMSGSVVSARKLAASFWEQYGMHKLDHADDQHSPHAQAPQQPPSNTPASPCMPPKFQVLEALLEDTTETCGPGQASHNNMASSPAGMLANVLHRMQSMEETQSRSTAMLSKLVLDIEDVTSRVQELEFSHQSALREINGLLQRFGEQMAISRKKEQEKARLAFMCLRAEMEEERSASRVLKLQNKKLSKDLTHANIAAADACEELDRERKARELLEEVCNELAREIGEDKAEVEQLKQEQAKSRERLEEELRRMRMAAATWGRERGRSKLSEVDLEPDTGTEGMPLHELRRKLETFISTIGGTVCRGSQEEIAKQAKQAKLLSQALELLELEESRERQNNVAKDLGAADPFASSPSACTNTCFIGEKAMSANIQYGDGDNHIQGDQVTVDGLENRCRPKKTRKTRRRVRASVQQRHNLGVQSQGAVYDQSKPSFWEMRCANSAWTASSDDEVDRGQLTASQSPLQGGHAVYDYNLGHVRASSLNLELDSMLLASSHVGHPIQKMKPSVIARASEHATKSNACHPEQNTSLALGNGPHRKHSSARFEVSDTGVNMQYSFSEDDVASYGGRHSEQRRKQQDTLHTRSMRSSETMQMGEARGNPNRNDQYVHQHHDDLDNSKSTSRGDTDSVLEAEFYIEPVRGPSNASDAKLSHKANGNEDGILAARQLERGFSNCGNEACYRIMVKASQACKELKDKVHVCAESSRTASQEVRNAEGSTTFGVKEAMNKMSPWRSASASASKPLPCFWPPSPDASSIFGGAKKQSKAASASSTPPPSIDNEQQVNSGGKSRAHTRHSSPAKEASYQHIAAREEEHHVCVKSTSLGAQLIKAREHDKPMKPSFRFSPLRRAISHG